MMDMTMGALIDHLQRNYKWDDTLLVDIYNEDDYRDACGDTTIPWSQGASLIASDGGMDWLNPEVQNSMAQIIGEEEEK